MKQYKYKLLEETDVSSYSIDDINKLGEEGWRVVYTTISDSGSEATLLEKVDETNSQ